METHRKYRCCGCTVRQKRAVQTEAWLSLYVRAFRIITQFNPENSPCIVFSRLLYVLTASSLCSACVYFKNSSNYCTAPQKSRSAEDEERRVYI